METRSSLSSSTVVGIFTNINQAREAQRDLEAAGFSSSVSLVENDQDELFDDKVSGRSENSGGIGGFFARLFGFDDDKSYDSSRESHSYFGQQYAAKNHIVIVRDVDDPMTVRSILTRNGATIEDRGTQLYEEERMRTGFSDQSSMSTERSGFGTEQDAIRTEQPTRVMQLNEEELLASKERVETGELSIRKTVVQETKTIEVPVTREELVIERRDLHGEARPGSLNVSDLDENETIRIPVSEEIVHVEKRVKPREEILVGKKSVTENEVVSDTIRKEEARVETKGKVSQKRTDRDFSRDDQQPGL